MNVICLHTHRKSPLETISDSVLVGSDIALIIVVELNLIDARMLTASYFHCGQCATRIIYDVIIAHDSAETLICWLVVGVVGEGCLEASIHPVRRGIRRLT